MPDPVTLALLANSLGSILAKRSAGKKQDEFTEEQKRRNKLEERRGAIARALGTSDPLRRKELAEPNIDIERQVVGGSDILSRILAPLFLQGAANIPGQTGAVGGAGPIGAVGRRGL